MAVGRPEIDPTWLEPGQPSAVSPALPAGRSQTPETRPPVGPPATPPPPPKPPPPHLPRDERSQPLPQVRSHLSGLSRSLIAGIGVLVLAVGLFLASEAGWLSLGIEQLWGISNRPAPAFHAASGALAATARYHVDAELRLTFTQPLRMPRLGEQGLVQSSGSALLASADEGATFLSARMRQDVADGRSLTESELQFAAPRVVRAQMGPPFTHETPLRVDALAADGSLFLRLPQEAPQWTTVSSDEFTSIGIAPLEWAALYQTLGQAASGGKRLRGKTINGEPAKGYQATVPGSAVAALFAPGITPAGDVEVESWIGTKTHRPYLLTLRGAIGPAEPVATVVFGQFDGAQTVLTPGAGDTRAGTLRDWVIAHTLVAADSAQSRDALRKADLARIKEALATYATAARPFAYPKTDGIIQLGQANDASKALQAHLSPLPADPLAPNRYYGYSSDGTTYRLTAVLESPDDPHGAKEGDLTLYVVTP